jgi:hypothetical protein
MSYARGPKPGLSRGAALSVLWLDGDAPEPNEVPPDSGAAHVVAVARAKARVAARRQAQRERRLDVPRDPRRGARSKD